MSVSSSDHGKWPSDETDATDATSVGSMTGTVIYPSNPHTMTLREAPGSMWQHELEFLGSRAPIHTTTITASHDLVKKWNESAASIIKILNHYQGQWVGVELVERYQVISNSYPTCLITLSKMEQLSQAHLLKIGQLVSQVTNGVYVEITEGHVFRTGDFLTSEAKLKLPYKRAPIMGSSISVSEIDHASGTFGGYLELFNADVVKTCGLSCHHVLFPIAPADLTLADLRPYAKSLHENITICSPAIYDHNRSLNIDQEDIDHATKEKDTLLKQLEHLGAEAPRQTSQAIQRADTRIATKVQRIHDASVDRNIGEVFFSSGYKLDGEAQCQLDYGLIEMYPARVGTNEIPNDENSFKVTYIAKIPLEGGKVRKFGRTTDITEGYINPVDSFIRFKGTAFEMVSKEKMIYGIAGKPFTLAGDSGAWVVDVFGGLIGMVWGGFTSHEGSFLTPISLITEDITKQTGSSLFLPLPSDRQDFTGDLTYYGTGLGACGVTSTDADNIVSISHFLFDSQQTGSDPNLNPLCGLQIRAERFDEQVNAMRSVDVTVVDRCTGCAPTDLDVSPGVFSQLADPAKGRVTVTWAWLSPVPTTASR
ncbi:hypothetical protein MMC19_002766 [Ptychographa xylographoides]|nr:hypothetical protein [Ptychographa xylographoides]